MEAFKNFEVKVKISGYDNYRRLAFRFAKPDEHFIEKQEDIYYNLSGSLLKLRIKNGKTGTLVYYKKSLSGKKLISNYMLAEATEPKNLDYILTKIHGRKITIKKTREIFIFDNIRVHLDKVSGLGTYLEFEIIYKSLAKAKKQMSQLIKHFALDENNFIDVSYIDLLINKTKNAK